MPNLLLSTTPTYSHKPTFEFPTPSPPTQHGDVNVVDGENSEKTCTIVKSRELKPTTYNPTYETLP